MHPSRRLGGLAQSVIERVFIDGLVTGGANGAVRAASAAVRAVQTGFLRNYAALHRRRDGRCHRLLPPPDVTVHLSILIFLPLAAAVVGLLLPAALARVAAIAGAVLALVYAIVAVADFDSRGEPACSSSRTSVDLRARASTGSSASTG